MNSIKLIYRNIIFYRQYYILLLLAALLANAIISGSLMVGDSISYTLVKRVDERLGKSTHLVSSGSGFLDAEISNGLTNSAEALFTNGFVSHNQALIPVNIWGVSNSFNKITYKALEPIAPNCVAINKQIASKYNLSVGNEIVVRLPALSIVPSGSLFISDNYTTSLRLKITEILDKEQVGNLSVKNEQTIPLNLFVDINFLNQTLELENKCNMLFCTDNTKDFSSIWQPSYSGLMLKDTVLTSDKLFIEKHISESIKALTSHKVFAYFVNKMSAVKNSNKINYSFVTAIDSYKNRKIKPHEMLISDYAAQHLGLSIGDTVALEYFVTGELRKLSEQEAKFVVSDIIPINEWFNEKLLTADFPGLTEAESCSSWESALPIDMNAITDADELYWEQYKATPKAIISYEKGREIWANDFGDATALVLKKGVDSQQIKKLLLPESFGIAQISLRDNGVRAAVNGIDFKSLFLSLAFFIIVAALFLATLPLSKMLHDRHKEIEQYRSLGWKKNQLIILLLNELKLSLFVGVILGIGFAFLYNVLVLKALNGIWNDAVQTESILMHISLPSIVIGTLSSFAITSLFGFLTIRKLILHPPKGGLKIKRPNIVLLIVSALALLISLAAAFVQESTPELFIVNGVLVFVFIVILFDYLIKKLFSAKTSLTIRDLIVKNIYKNRASANTSMLTLALGVFIVFAVGLFSKDFTVDTNITSKTGGYNLWCDLQVPMPFDLNSNEGKERFGLENMPPNTHFSQIYKLAMDDANCLNVNMVEQPTVLGVDADDFKETLAFAKVLDQDVWSSFDEKQGRYYPAIADETVIMWSLGKQLGDTLVYHNSEGKQIVFQLVGALNNTVFQGSILIDKKVFLENWKEESGSKLLLAKTDDIKAAQTNLSIALRDYGASISTTAERLQNFYSVTASYLTIFMMLGGFGLIIGLFGLIIVLYKNLTSRKQEIIQMKNIGFNNNIIFNILFKEAIVIPLFAIVSGSLASLVTVVGSISSISASHAITFITVVVILLIVSYVTTLYICKKIISQLGN